MTKLTTVKGYTAQARYYAEHMALEPVTEEWIQAGWIPDRGGAKPVYWLTDGRTVAIFAGNDIRSIVVYVVEPSEILPTEEACWATVRSVVWTADETTCRGTCCGRLEAEHTDEEDQ